MKDLAQRLLDWEELNGTVNSHQADAATRVIEKLRILLTRFSGIDGFNALLGRAVVLARTDGSPVITLTKGKDRSILFEGQSEENILMITAHLLDLMATFIGKGLTLTMLTEIWPLDN